MSVVHSARLTVARRFAHAIAALCSAIALAACSTQGSSDTVVARVPLPPTVPLGFNGVNTGPMTSGGALLFPAGPPNTTIRIALGAIPANETASYVSAVPPGVALVATFVGGVVFTVGPNPVPVSSVANVLITLPAAPASRIGGYIIETGGSGASAPLTVTAAVSGQSAAQTYTPPPQANAPVLTTLAPNTSYFLFIAYM